MTKTTEQRLQQVEDYCQQAGIQFTPLRKTLLTLIYTQKKHLTAYELLALLREINPKAQSMTVYRTLDFLQEQQLIHRIASKSTYVACCLSEHHHQAQILLCEQCGEAEEIDVASFKKAMKKLADEYEFQLSEKPVELTGTCKSCVAVFDIHIQSRS